MSTMQDHPAVTMSADKSTVLPRYDVVGCIYAPSREVAESRLQEDIYMDHAEIVYPAGQIYTLTPDVLDTIRLALMDRINLSTGYLISDAARASFQRDAQLRAAYWAGELWQIDRARRALGIED